MSIPGLEHWLDATAGPPRARLGKRASTASLPTSSVTTRCSSACRTRPAARKPHPVPPEGRQIRAHGRRRWTATCASCPSPQKQHRSRRDAARAEFYDDPHQILREVERILIPEGRSCSPASTLFAVGPAPPPAGAWRQFPWLGQYLSATPTGLAAAARLRGGASALRLPCSAVPQRNGCAAGPGWNRRASAAGRPAARVYVLRAIKRVHGMRLILPRWQTSGRRAKALAPVTPKENPNHGQ